MKISKRKELMSRRQEIAYAVLSRIKPAREACIRALRKINQPGFSDGGESWLFYYSFGCLRLKVELPPIRSYRLMSRSMVNSLLETMALRFSS